jgi:hypothetical protein
VKPRHPRRSVRAWTVQLALAFLLAPLLLGYHHAAIESSTDHAPEPAHNQRALRTATRVLRGSRRRVALRGIDLARRLRLTALLHHMIGLLPRPAAERLDNARRDLRMRAGEPVPAAQADELEPAFRQALSMLATQHPSGPHAIGDYLEFGVYVGTSMASMHRVVDDLGLDHVRLFGFDSFEGLPDAARDEENGFWRAGMYRSDIELTRERLTDAGVDWDRVHLVKGWFDETLTDERAADLGIERASVVMVDCDLYSSTTAVMDFCEPLLADEAIVIFDDFRAGDSECPRDGERRAFEEFLDTNRHFTATELPHLTYSDTSSVFRVTRRNGNGHHI